MTPRVSIEMSANGVWHLQTYAPSPPVTIPAQATAAYNATFLGYLSDHYFRAKMELTITGNFSYGSVPGCGRVNSTTVKCTWTNNGRFFFNGKDA